MLIPITLNIYFPHTGEDATGEPDQVLHAAAPKAPNRDLREQRIEQGPHRVRVPTHNHSHGVTASNFRSTTNWIAHQSAASRIGAPARSG